MKGTLSEGKTKKLQPYMKEGRRKQLGKIGTGRSVVS
jgi:hypothetical protein